jgi:hypothetical protein
MIESPLGNARVGAQVKIMSGREVEEDRGAGDVSRSKKPAGCPLASASREWADGFAACKRAVAEASILFD